MRLDLVHDIQQVYRRLVETTARPGTIAELEPIAASFDIPVAINRTVLLLALTLLDGEVTFAVASRRAVQDAHSIARLTYARRVEIDEAAFVFVLAGDEERSAAEHEATEAIVAAGTGTLVDPHLGATIIIEVSSLAVPKTSGVDRLVLDGPGIDGEAQIEVAGASAWIDARNAACSEYPLGVDLYLVDTAHRVAALPRTTRVRRAGSTGAR